MDSIKMNEQYLIEIGRRIADARHAKGEKAETLAQVVGLSQATISRIENGTYTGLKATTIRQIAEYLNIPLSDIYPP